jgi:hypothetical protein
MGLPETGLRIGDPVVRCPRQASSTRKDGNGQGHGGGLVVLADQAEDAVAA